MAPWFCGVRSRVRRAVWTPKKQERFWAFISHWWTSTWIVLAVLTLASGFLAGEDITFEPALAALAVLMVLITDKVKTRKPLGLILGLIGILAGYLGVAQSVKASGGQVGLFLALAALMLVSALYGVIVTIITARRRN